MIGLAWALGAEQWDRSQTRENLRAISEGALNTALGTIGTLGLLSLAAACAFSSRSTATAASTVALSTVPAFFACLAARTTSPCAATFASSAASASARSQSTEMESARSLKPSPGGQPPGQRPLVTLKRGAPSSLAQSIAR